MEESSGLCVDPEEDEIFFYGVTEKESELKNILGDKSTKSETGINSEHLSEESNQISEMVELNLGSANSGNDLRSLIKTEQIPDTILPGTGSNMYEGSSKIFENTAEKLTVLNDEINSQGDVTLDGNKKKEINSTNSSTPDGKKEEVYQNNVNIHVDHNYSTPVKTVIDKNILKTPKSVVKADKDGGFLKVLSEIALVKAEVDENIVNNASTFSDSSCKTEVADDDNKENEEKSVEQTVTGLIEAREATPIKLFEVEEKLNAPNGCDQFSINNEMPNESIPHNVNYENIKNSEKTSEHQNLKNVNNFEGEIISSGEDNLPDIESVPPCKENSDNLNDAEVVFQKLATNLEETSNEDKTEKTTDVSDLIILDSFIDKTCVEGLESAKGQDENHQLEVTKKNNFNIPVINILDESLNVQNGEEDDCIFLGNGISNEDERHKRFLRRKTMKLLEELSEIVSHGQMKSESESIANAGLSDEAAKVIQKLKAVGIDDSINSPDQYFDLDNLNETFLSTEVSDILNDTLSKPLNLLTNKDMEALLEKISLEDKFQTQTDILDAEKENVCQNKIQETLNRKIENPIIEKTPMKFVHSVNFRKTPVALKSNTPAQLNTQQKYTPNVKCSLEKKPISYKPLIQSQVNRNGIRGCRTVEKTSRPNLDTRIPKLTSTTSKIPVKGTRDVKMQGRNPTPNKTPYSKASKTLKFDNIESPVQAYINAKTPVLISNVKAKPERGFNIWPKETNVGGKLAKPQVETKLVKSDQRINLPYVKYRSAIPLKLEKAPESRLPRLAPKMQKLILGNSPVIAKHEGRIQLTASTRPQISMNESSIMLKPNEVSVIVRKVALKSNDNK